MTASRAPYVLFGLASPHSSWFRELSMAATEGALPVRFLKCLSAEELLERLRAGQAASCIVVDSRLASVDRDLLASLKRNGIPILVIDAGRGRNWRELGADAVLAEPFSSEELCSALANLAKPIETPIQTQSSHEASAAPGILVACSGPGGAGTSTIAQAAAQVLGSSFKVVLADMSLSGEQAFLHGCPPGAPGLLELIEAHRLGEIDPTTTISYTRYIQTRGYSLLAGIPQPHFWPAVRPVAFSYALGSLMRAFSMVIADTDNDLEGAAESGSLDIEERNVMTRSCLRAANLVLVVGRGGMKGLYSLVRSLLRLASFGVQARQVIAVVNCAPHRATWRWQTSRTLEELCDASLPSEFSKQLASPLFIGEERLEGRLRNCLRLPKSLTDPLARRLKAMLSGPLAGPDQPSPPRRMSPEEVGTWTASWTTDKASQA